MSAPSRAAQGGASSQGRGSTTPSSRGRAGGGGNNSARFRGSRGRGRGAATSTNSRGGSLLQGLRSGTINKQAGQSSGTPQPNRGRGMASLGPSRAGQGRGHLSWTPNNSHSDSPASQIGEAKSASHKDFMAEMNTKFQLLKQRREAERAKAIRDGFLADPEKKTSLDKAITPVGTCTEMCPEFERVERIVQNMVDKAEKESDESSGRDVPSEQRMVKRFRRSAAGYDEQLPSDIRTPATLQKTLDYLLDTVVGGGEKLASIHKFVWDRTRGIRNDFSIQQVSKDDDVRIAVDCFERITRFHILSLHQLSNPDNLAGENFDAYQEREQLNNALLSLMYYYDDHRHKHAFPNEAEFRAYCIIFELQSQHPDLEDRMQSWPQHLLNDKRVQTAFGLYLSTSNTLFDQGPLRPLTPFSVAQGNTGNFWTILESKAVSYLMACVAEIYFSQVRYLVLQSLWTAYKGPSSHSFKLQDWTLGELTEVLGFDREDETFEFCSAFGLRFKANDQGVQYLDFLSQASMLDQSSIPTKQVFSWNYVEAKRYRRTLMAVISNIAVAQAIREGLVETVEEAEAGSNAQMGDNPDETLFIPESTSTTPQTAAVPAAIKLNPFVAAFNPTLQKDQGASGAPPDSSGQPATGATGAASEPSKEFLGQQTSVKSQSASGAPRGLFGQQNTSIFNTTASTSGFGPSVKSSTSLLDFPTTAAVPPLSTTPLSPPTQPSTRFSNFQGPVTSATTSAFQPSTRFTGFNIAQPGEISTATTPASTSLLAAPASVPPFSGFKFAQSSASPQNSTSLQSSSVFAQSPTLPSPSNPFSIFEQPSIAAQGSVTQHSQERKAVFQNTEKPGDRPQFLPQLPGAQAPTVSAAARTGKPSLSWSFPASTSQPNTGSATQQISSPSPSQQPTQSILDGPIPSEPPASPRSRPRELPKTFESQRPLFAPSTSTPLFHTTPAQRAVGNTQLDAASSLTAAQQGGFASPPSSGHHLSYPSPSTLTVPPGPHTGLRFDFNPPSPQQPPPVQSSPQPPPTLTRGFQPGFDANATSSTASNDQPPVFNVPSVKDLLLKSTKKSSRRPSSSALPRGDATPHKSSPLHTQPVVYGEREESPKPKAPQPTLSVRDRDLAAETIARLGLLQPSGIMRQFLESILPNIVQDAIDQYEREQPVFIARAYRINFLAKKYLSKWKTNVWRLAVNRRAQDRRRIISKFIDTERQNKMRGEDELEAILQIKQEKDKQHADRQGRTNSNSPEPGQLAASQKRKSLFGDQNDGLIKGDTPRQVVKGHKRSRTMGSSEDFPRTSTSMNGNVPPRSDFASSVYAEQSHAGRLRNSTDWRRSMSGGKVDKTRTDYFRLKALNIDPDTPFVPETKASLAKKSRLDQARTLMRRSRIGSPSSTSSASPQQRAAADVPGLPFTTAAANAALQRVTSMSPSQTSSLDDDPVIRQIRELRAALSEGSEWFKSQTAQLEKEVEEREEVGRSVSQASSRRDSLEVDSNGLAQVNGYSYLPGPDVPGRSLSRTEERIRRTGAHGLATKTIGGSSDYLAVAMSKRTAREAGLLETPQRRVERGDVGTSEKTRRKGKRKRKSEEGDMNYVPGHSSEEEGGMDGQHRLMNGGGLHQASGRRPQFSPIRGARYLYAKPGEEVDEADDSEGDDGVAESLEQPNYHDPNELYGDDERGDEEDDSDDEEGEENDELEALPEHDALVYKQANLRGGHFLRSSVTPERTSADYLSPDMIGGTQMSRATSGTGASADDAFVLDSD